MRENIDNPNDTESAGLINGTTANDVSAPEALHRHTGSKIGLWIGILILFIPLAVYFITICPTVFIGDSGDFVTAAFTLGIPHPPGYPVYTILGHILTKLPIPGGISAPAFRMNVMSAICAWLACLFMFLWLRRIIRTEWAAIVGALALAFSREFWTHAEIAEVYTMEIMFLTLIFYLSVLYVQTKKIGLALFLSFILGLALSHHYAILIFYPGVLIFIGINGGLKLRWHTWVLAVILALIGLMPYAYLPVVRYKTPIGKVYFNLTPEEMAKLPKDAVAASETPLQYFLFYVSRKFYSMGREYSNRPEVLTERTTTPMVFKRFLEVTQDDFALPLMIFALIGWLAIIISMRGGKSKKKEADEPPLIPRAAFLPPALGYILYFLVVHFYPSGDILNAPLANIAVVIPPLLIPLQATLAPIIALGFDFSVRVIESYVRSQGVRNVTANPKYRTFAGLLLIAAFLLIGLNVTRNFQYCDKSQSLISYNYTLNVLDSCDPGSILLTTGDETFLFWYAQYCEPSNDPADSLPGYRKDVWATNWIHNLTDLAMLTNEHESMKLVTENFILNSGYYSPYLKTLGINGTNYFGPRPINSTFVAESYAESDIILGLDVIFQGLVYSFRRPGDIPTIENPNFKPTANIAPVMEGAAPLAVIDYYDSTPFDNYRWGGLPGFDNISEDFSNVDKASYHSVNLDPQEEEALGRYQDSLYRFGVRDLLDDSPEFSKEAVQFLFRCVELDPDGWFGWKELGDAYFKAGSLESAEGAYRQLIDIAAKTKGVDPKLEASAHSSLAHIYLIKSNLDDSEKEATLALVLNPDDRLARAVLVEINRQRSGAYKKNGTSSSGEQPADESNGSTTGEGAVGDEDSNSDLAPIPIDGE